MKHFLFILSLVVPLNIFGQIDTKVFEFENVNFKSLIIRTTYPDRNDTWKHVYLYENGLKVSEKSFMNDTLNSYSEYSYKNGKLVKSETHNQIYSYDSELDKHVGKIREDYYYGKEYTYENNLPSIIIDYDVNENSKSYNFEKLLQYDAKNQLVKEIHIDKYIGFTGDFETNSVNLDTLFYKNTIDKSYKTLEYFADSVVIKYYENNSFSGYELYLGQLETPSEIKTFSNSNELLRHEIYERDDNGFVVRIIFKLKSGKNAWGHGIDYSMEDRISIDYDKKGLPVKESYYKGNRLLMTKVFEYNAL